MKVLILAVALAVLIVGPGFVLLYVLTQRGALPEEGVPDAADPVAENEKTRSDGRGGLSAIPVLLHPRRRHFILLG